MGLRSAFISILLSFSILLIQACGGSQGVPTSQGASPAQAAQNPIPTITTIHGAKGEGPRLHIVGNGYIPSSAVFLNDRAWTAAFVNAGELTVNVLESDVPNDGVIRFKVVNPQPGGGTSNIYTLTFVTVTPVITSIQPNHAVAGSAAFGLAVLGRNFYPNSVVRWNSQTLATTFQSSTQLTANVTTELVAKADTAQISVFTDGVAGGASSNVVAFTIDAQSNPSSADSITLRVNALAFDPVSQTLYASTPGSTGADSGNAIVEINTSGSPKRIRSTFVGSEPGPIALSQDGSTLYVGLQGAGAVRRYDTGTHVPGDQFVLGSDNTFGVYIADDIAILPGSNSTVAVARKVTSSSPGGMGVAVYSNGVKEPNELGRWSPPFFYLPNQIEFGTRADVLYGLGDSWGFRRMKIDSNGVSLLDTDGSFNPYLGRSVVWSGGKLYGIDGPVIDPDVKILLGTYPAIDTSSTIFAVFPDPKLKRVFFIRTNFERTLYELLEFDMDSYILLKKTVLTGIQGQFIAASYLENRRFAIATETGKVYFASAQ
jgi:trimeric autotransporter adhesin